MGTFEDGLDLFLQYDMTMSKSLWGPEVEYGDLNEKYPPLAWSCTGGIYWKTYRSFVQSLAERIK